MGQRETHQHSLGVSHELNHRFTTDNNVLLCCNVAEVLHTNHRQQRPNLTAGN